MTDKPDEPDELQRFTMRDMAWADQTEPTLAQPETQLSEAERRTAAARKNITWLAVGGGCFVAGSMLAWSPIFFVLGALMLLLAGISWAVTLGISASR